MGSYDDAKLLCTTLRLYVKKFTEMDNIDDVVISPLEWNDTYFIITLKNKAKSSQSSIIRWDILKEIVEGFTGDKYMLRNDDIFTTTPVFLYFEKIE